MVMDLFKSIGIVVALVVFAVMTIAFMYISYILAIGFIIVTLIFITYYTLRTIKAPLGR
jgi:hypothetical protein